MKKITVVIPTYNEEVNVRVAYEEVKKVMESDLKNYEWEIMYIDNCSIDKTRLLIRELSEEDSHVKAIFNARNFGQARSHFYGLTQAEGDCAILLHADLQNPPAVMVDFVREWENGSKVVVGIKDKSKESKLLFFFRTIYYKVMARISDVEQIQHFSDFELLDKDFIKVLRELHEPLPYLRGIVSELGFKMSRVHYLQNKRERGKTTASFRSLYDFGMNGITSYSKDIMRIATISGFCLSFVCAILAVAVVISKIINWDSYQTGVAAIGTGVFFLSSVQLFFIGLLGEYVMNINTRVMDRPLVIEEERIGF